MSLVGNLEDLGLGDILQIVSLSRKSGILSLKSGESEGKIYFSNGQVIKACSNVSQENIGELLIRKKLVNQALLDRALSVQKQSQIKKRIGAILCENFKVPRESIEETVREQIEKIIYGFFSWERGIFDFELGEPEDIASTNFNPLQFMLEQGLNPQWLALEGSRLLDERKHAGTNGGIHEKEPSAGVYFSRKDWLVEKTSHEDAADELAEDTRVVIVDDDRNTRISLCASLADRGLKTAGFADGNSLLEALKTWEPANTPPVFVFDLIMATLDGEGIFGGLELASKIKDRWPFLRILLMTDHSDAYARKRAQGLQIEEILSKPSKKSFKDEGDHLAVREFIDKLAAVIENPSRIKDRFFHIGEEIFAEEGARLIEKSPSNSESSDKMAQLKGILEELCSPLPLGGIPLLALRLAGELFNRAVIFSRRGNAFVGHGQFGMEACCANADTLVREIVISTADESAFAKVLREAAPQILVPGPTPVEKAFFEKMKGGVPVDMFLGPILCFGEVAYLLYGDNRPETLPVGDTGALEVFLVLAGLALEKENLEKELQKRSAV